MLAFANLSEHPVDLTTAMRLLNEEVRKDGDLGAEYWDSVMRILIWAGQKHAALLQEIGKAQGLKGTNFAHVDL